MVHAIPLRNTKQRGWEGEVVGRKGEPCQGKKKKDKKKKDDTRDPGRHGWIDQGFGRGGGEKKVSGSPGSRRVLLKMNAASQSRRDFYFFIFFTYLFLYFLNGSSLGRAHDRRETF